MVNSQKAQPMRPIVRTTQQSFTLVRRMGARFDGTLRMRVSDGTSVRFRTSEYDLCPLQESVTRQRDVKGVRIKYVLSLT